MFHNVICVLLFVAAFSIISFINKKIKAYKYANRTEQDAHSDDAIEALEEGDLPQYVKDRIEKEKNHQLPWTSDLGVSEWLLLKKYNMKPLGMAMGSSVYSIYDDPRIFLYDVYRSNNSSVHEVTRLESGYHASYQIALSRLQQEAKLMGAHAVVAVKIKRKRKSRLGNTYEHTAFGTAITLSGTPLPEEPLISNVSMIEFAKLIAAGSIPTSIAVGVGVFCVFRKRLNVLFRKNEENKVYTNAIYHARNSACKDLYRKVRQEKGHGVLADEFIIDVEEFEIDSGGKQYGYLVSAIGLGTVVESIDHYQPTNPKVVLELN